MDQYSRLLYGGGVQNRYNPLLLSWFIAMTNKMAVVWNTYSKKWIIWAFEFFVSVISHNPIIWLHLFWDSFERFCLQIRSDAKYFFLSCPRHCVQGLIIVKACYFQIWKKKEHIIICRVISSLMGPRYFETPNIRWLCDWSICAIHLRVNRGHG